MNPDVPAPARDVGDLLKEQGILSEKQLELVRRRQARLAIPQYQAIVDLNYASEEDTYRALATLNHLLDAVQHGATEQRAAIDALVASTAAWLEQTGARFTAKLDAETARMESVAAQLTLSAVDVASLGEAFGAAVEGFSQSSDKLMAHLQRVDDSLGKSIARSDEQLAYYVAQAREVIDLSLASQTQIVEDLQRIAGRRAAPV